MLQEKMVTEKLLIYAKLITPRLVDTSLNPGIEIFFEFQTHLKEQMTRINNEQVNKNEMTHKNNRFNYGV